MPKSRPRNCQRAEQVESGRNGPFGSMRLGLPFGLSVQAEYDSRQMNYGLRLAPFSGVALQASSLGGDTTAISAQLDWRL